MCQIVAAEVVYFYHLGDGAPLPLSDADASLERALARADDGADDDDVHADGASPPSGCEPAVAPEEHVSSTPVLLGRLEAMAVDELDYRQEVMA